MTMVKLIIKLITWGGSQSARSKLIGWARLACVDAPGTQMISANHNSGPNLLRSLTFNTMTKTVFAIVANIWINLFRWWKANMYGICPSLWSPPWLIIQSCQPDLLQLWGMCPIWGKGRRGESQNCESANWCIYYYSLLVKSLKIDKEERWQATLYPYPSVSENNKVNCKTNFETSPSCHTS